MHEEMVRFRRRRTHSRSGCGMTPSPPPVTSVVVSSASLRAPWLPLASSGVPWDRRPSLTRARPDEHQSAHHQRHLKRHPQ
jgi:hypothetical protein